MRQRPVASIAGWAVQFAVWEPAAERDRAVADINIAKNQALDQIAQKSVQTAVSLASNIIRREVKPQDHEALIGEAVNQFSKLN